MALRSLPGKLKDFLRGRTAASPPAANAAASPPVADAAASDMEPIKIESVEAQYRAIMKGIREQQRIRAEERKRENWRIIRNLGIGSVVFGGIIAWFVRATNKASAEIERMLMDARGPRQCDVCKRRVVGKAVDSVVQASPRRRLGAD